MKRKSLLLGAALVLAAGLTACGGGTTSTETTSAEGTSTETTSTETTSASSKKQVLVWCAEEIVELTTTQVNRYATEYALTNDYEFVVNPMGEGSAAGNMIQDVEKGADVYCFAQDQFARLVAAGALAKLPDAVSTAVASANDAGSVSAATLEDKLYAYPLTSDNGYFMYYDKTVVAEEHLDSLEDILADCVNANKEFYFDGPNGWYNAGFFFGAGCESTWTADATGAFTKYVDTYDSANGLVAIKGLSKLVTSSAYVAGSSAPTGFNGNAAVVVSGTWDYAKTAEILGDNLGCAELPNVTVGEKTFHIGSFGGFKLVGVKPSLDAAKLGVAHGLATYITSEACQLERFNAKKWGPSNLNAQKDEAVKENPGLVALQAQSAYAVPQGQYPDGWWPHAAAIGSSVLTAGADATDDALQAILTSYSSGLDDLLG